jgi:3-oxoacyl-[acyl-carrier-protein] synthase II
LTDRIAITGLGVVSPLGSTHPKTWRSLLEGRSGLRALDPAWSADLASHVGGVSSFEIHALLEPHRARRLDRSAQMGLLAAQEAWTHAGRPKVAAERLGVVFGTGMGGLATLQEQLKVLREQGPARVNPLTVPMIMPNAVAAQIALLLGARGPLEAPVSACASGADAILWGARLLQQDLADVVVVGGCDALLNRAGMAAFGAMRALAAGDGPPEEASRPFDRDRCGFVMGEGAAALVLERPERARARNAPVHGWLRGGAVTADAHHITTPQPEGREAERAMRQALEQAGVSPHDLRLVKAHGTGTVQGDHAEALALARLFDTAAAPRPWLLAPKAAVGHLIGGAGALEAVLTVLCLREGLVPAQRNCPHPDPALPLPMPRSVSRLEGPAKLALANAFGFGGKNVVLVFEGPG